MNNNVYNLALVFEEDVDKRLRVLTRAIEAASGAKYDSGRPHITLAQFEAHPEGAQQIWRHLRSVIPAPIAVDFAGITFLPSKDGGQWVEVSVTRTHALTEAQDAVTRAFPKIRLLNQAGEGYRPHVTLSKTATARGLPVAFDYELLRQKGVRSYPAFDVAGGDFKAFTTLHR
jgi:2'-5' RNA ligase